MGHNFSRFNKQVAVVTGGADGIGKAVAKRLSDEGAKVYLFDSDQNLLDKTEEEISRSSKVHVDVADDDSVRQESPLYFVEQLGLFRKKLKENYHIRRKLIQEILY